jgi:hypothetical protein
LRPTVGACCELEDRTEILFDDLTQRVNRGRVSELRWLLWAALQAQHAATFPAPENTTVLIDTLGIPAIRSVLGTLLRLNADDDQPKPKKGAKPPKPDERPGTLWRRLYLDARMGGIPGETFWRLSLRELWLELAADRQAQQRARDRIVTQAWWTAALVWQTKLPDLETLLSPTPTTQTPEQQRAVMAQLSASLGVPLIRITLPQPSRKGSQTRGQ